MPIAPKHSPADADAVTRPESFDRKALAAAFLRARELITPQALVTSLEALQLEQALRPLASASEIQQVVVPMLDRARLFGLAMAWDSGVDNKAEDWLLSRVTRWLALGAPEFAFITMTELNRSKNPCADALRKAQAALGVERELRTPIYEANLRAVAEVDAELEHALNKSHRTSVALRSLGAGMAEFAGPGQPWVQLWAVTPAQALNDADGLVRGLGAFEDVFVAGVGDCTLPTKAALLRATGSGRVHVVDLHIARVRALLELVDLSAALRERRLWLHVGPRAVETLAPFAASATSNPGAVIGGDAMGMSLLRSAAGLEA